MILFPINFWVFLVLCIRSSKWIFVLNMLRVLCVWKLFSIDCLLAFGTNSRLFMLILVVFYIWFSYFDTFLFNLFCFWFSIILKLADVFVFFLIWYVIVVFLFHSVFLLITINIWIVQVLLVLFTLVKF